MIAWRHHLHANPELGFQETQTAAFIQDRLNEFGVDEIHTGLAGTGVVGVVRSGAGDRKIALRADMDALPIQEQTNLGHASKTEGVMHACGHDGHVTMLLGAARHLAETRQFDGTVYLVFQPAEEGHGGARVMVREGLFERFPADKVFGMHNWPGANIGHFAIRPGPVMAASDTFSITLVGEGGHAALPHTVRDPMPATGALIQGLHSIVSRAIAPRDSAVISVTRVRGGDAYNVIPEAVELWGTTRCFDEEIRSLCQVRIECLARGVAEAYGLEARIDYQRGYPPTVNTEMDATFAADAAASIVGEQKVDRNVTPSTGSEDFAYMLEERPGAYILMGNGSSEGGRVLHSPHYDFNDRALVFGASYWVSLAERYLNHD